MAANPVLLLVDQLKSDDTALRLNAVRGLSSIARVLGPERTRSELIRYITENVDDEDLILQALAEELGEFVPFVGGPNYVADIVPPLEMLASAEEVTVRNASVASLGKIITSVTTTNALSEIALTLIHRLVQKDWPTSRSSAAALIPLIFAKTDERTKAQLILIFIDLCKDDTPSVKRAAATAFASLIPLVDSNLIKEFTNAFQALCNDDHDSVRLLMTDGFVSMAKRGALNTPMVTAKAMCTDASWRVRYMAADHFNDFCSVLSPPESPKEMALLFSGFLRDNEPEVKTIAALRLTELAETFGKEAIVSHVVPFLKEMTKDQSQHVRAALATSLGSLAPIIGKEESTKQLIEIALQLLKDDFSDTRLNMISHLDSINKTVGIEAMTAHLLPTIKQLAEDKQWRVRLSIIQQFHGIVANFGVEYFNDNILALCLGWLTDKVFSIREAAGKNLAELSKLFGPEWTKTIVVPKIYALHSHHNYLYRLTALFTIDELAPIISKDILANLLLPLVLQMTQDKIANVRFDSAITLGKLCKHLDQKIVQSSVKNTLTTLCDDNDNDVIYFARRTLNSI